MRPTRPLGLLLAGLGLLSVGLLLLAWGRSDLRTPATSTMVVDRTGQYLGEVNAPADGRLGFWPLEHSVGSKIAAATVAIEDRRFREHAGVDVWSVGRAVLQNLREGERISGASTLAMQVARMQDPGERTYGRKLVEAVTALVLVERHGHDAVLAHYLRLAPYGNNVHGARYAARRLFRKPVEDLTWAEASLLAALPQAPGTMNPYRVQGRRRAVKRAQQVLDTLLEQGVIDPAAHETALEELQTLRPRVRPERPASTLHPLLALEGQSIAPERRSTLDLELQEQVSAELVHAVTGWRDRGAGQGAVVVLDRQTLAVRAAVGSIGFDTEGGAIDFTRTPRTPGSTLKPLLYARALDLGLLTSTEILDDLQQGPEGIRNADQDFLGPLLPRQALANSRNVPAVNLAVRVGLDPLHDFFGTLGLHDETLPGAHYGLGLAIGGMPVTLLDLATAYGALANDGVWRAPHWWEDESLPVGRQVFEPDTARLVRDWLADPVARAPTFPRGGFTEHAFPVAWKTGTSPDHRDSWSVAITEEHVIGVWIGHPDWRPMRGLTGFRGAGEVLHNLVAGLNTGAGQGLRGFEPPTWETAEVCALSGALATPHCEATHTEYVQETPTQPCTAHVLDRGRVVLDLPPRYAEWLVRNHLPRRHATLDPRAPVVLGVLSPADGAQVMADPDVPASRSTLRLAAAVDPPIEQVVWYVDGVPFQTVSHPYVARWPIVPGVHTFEVRSALGRAVSHSVQIVAH